jgi:hypothetical protein
MLFMKTKSAVAVLCLFLFPLAAHAQQTPPQVDFMKMRNSPMMQQSMKLGMKNAVLSFWEGRGGNLMAIGLFADPDIRTAFGVSDEQYQTIQQTQMNIGAELQRAPEFQEMLKELQTFEVDPRSPNVDPETAGKFADIQGRMASLSIAIMSDAVGNVLTPEQKQKMMEAQLASMGEMPLISPGMFEALNLTAAQRQHMERIKKELEPEFEKHLETFANGAMAMSNKLFDELEKQGFSLDDFKGNTEEVSKIAKEFGEKMQGIQKKLMADDPEFKRLADDLQFSGKTFSTQFKIKMFDVLTDEQWARLQLLIDNPPVYAKALLKKMKEQSGRAEQAGGGWQPGPQSWQPGDPIPAEYREQRNAPKNFPRPKN